MLNIHKQQKSHFISGDFHDDGVESLTSYNPANDEAIWQGHIANQVQCVNAYQSAREAFHLWRDLNLDKRFDYLEEYTHQLQQHREQLSELLSEEHGKPLWESRAEVGAMINKLNISIQAYHERTGSIIDQKANFASKLSHVPLGVMFVIGPFNFPGHLPNGHTIPALLAGNTVVFKPSEHTPRFGLLMAQCMQEAGLPKGVFNVIQGGRQQVEWSLSCAYNGVLFTGSYEVGRAIHQQLAGKPEVLLALEMGGNNPLVVTEMTDLEAAVSQTILSAFITSGQRCTCARRLILTNDMKKSNFIEALIEKSQRIHMGRYHDSPEPFMGPLISKDASRSVEKRLQTLKSRGAALLLKGERDNAFISPSIVDMTDIRNDDEECFGPLLQLHWVNDLNDAITMANQTRYGLSAGIFTENKSSYERFALNARCGLLNWNRQTTNAVSNLPFGGLGFSGNYRPSAYYAADYCAHPLATLEVPTIEKVEGPMKGIYFVKAGN